jgi:branched-chain amino acid transport system substrate-binding protein
VSSAGGAARASGGATAAGPTAAGQAAVQSPSGAGAQQAAPGAAGPKAEIVLGSVGTETGPVGQQLLPLLQGARAWVADVNARGGLNGHRVRLVTGDDGGDPNRAQSLVRRMIEEDKVTAFYMERLPTTMPAVSPVLAQHRIPMVGSCNCTDAASKDRMVFEVGPGGGMGDAWMHIGPLLALSDKRKASVLYCREVSACATIKNNVRELARRSGVEIVHEAQVTITQPDYTAEVLAARNAGAEAFLLALDAFSQLRVARSAYRQNYHPLFVAQQGGHETRFVEAGGADAEAFLIGAAMPHWESPKLADYRSAMARYVPQAILGSLSETSWVTGKLLETIAVGFPDKPSSADVLRGLYALRGETVGGLIPPLSYPEDRGTDEESVCIVPVRVEKAKFVPWKGDEYLCAPGWQPVRK